MEYIFVNYFAITATKLEGKKHWTETVYCDEFHTAFFPPGPKAAGT
jgi:hypothetical protein